MVVGWGGLDRVGGGPRLLLFDLTGFYHGINCLVLAIGISGIGEMLWTVDSAGGKQLPASVTVSVKRTVAALRDLLKTTKVMLMGSFLG